MTLNERQRKIILFARYNGGKITKKQATDLIGHSYYYNGAHYVGEILTRLVKRQILRREKIGHYIFTGVTNGVIVDTVAANQTDLFA